MVLRGTPMAQMYFEPLTLEQAVRVTVGQLELLPAETVVERLTGDGARSEVLYPLWTCNKKRVLAEIDKRMAALNTNSPSLHGCTIRSFPHQAQASP